MDALVLINLYIKYVYYLLGLILLICLIVLAKNINLLTKTAKTLNVATDGVKQGIDEINEKLDKVQYTLEHSVPLFAFMFIAFIVIKAAIKDCRNSKFTNRNFVKSTVEEYRTISRKNKFKYARKYSTKFISKIIKMA